MFTKVVISIQIEYNGWVLTTYRISFGDGKFGNMTDLETISYRCCRVDAPSELPLQISRDAARLGAAADRTVISLVYSYLIISLRLLPDT
jgi:hypothetical protein